ncbi:hypothetical protein Glove_535g12 [Diversispora epigaea]|uniref:VWFA domain-containing protein n=1 Tax=Diversispora epigaea TaxID=1348612 RepID=A0A397GD93_9GLOM|nr:hypothetical protein Glove_535g12 [Diversispora epigaea]
MTKSSKNFQKTNQRSSWVNLDEKDENDDQESVDTQTDGLYNNKHDLCESIPGLYRLLDVYKDEVDKIIISDKYMKELCNEIVPNSYRSISKIRFEQLNCRQVFLIGCYGKNELIAKFLLQKGLIDQSAYESLLIPYNYNSINEKHIIPGLRPGIYLKKLSSDDDEIPKFMVLHWSEDGCYKGSASSFLKKNMTNFHRYLTKITSHQLCLMDDDDLECFDWQVFKVIEEDDDDEASDSGDDSICFTFEVKKSQEQKENFEFSPGFNIPFQKLAQISECNDGPPLHPLVIESELNQTFLIREMIPAEKTTETKNQTFESSSKFQDYFRQKLDVQKCSLKFDRNQMTIEKLEIIVKDGLLLPELFRPYNEALKSHEKKKNQMEQDTKNKINDMAIMKQMAFQLLKKTYSNFEDNIIEQINELSDKTVDDNEIYRVEQTYPNVCAKLLALVESITLESWNDNKNRFIFAKEYADGQFQDNVAKENILVYKIFFDNENDFIALVKKYTLKTNWSQVSSFLNNAKDIVSKIREASKKIPDGDFVRQISDYGDEKIAARFFEKYKDWKKHKFHESLKQIIRDFEHTERALNQKNESELVNENQKIRRQHFDEICDNLELKYPEGDLIMVMDVVRQIEYNRYYMKQNSYKLLRLIEIPHPEQLCVTIYSTQLGQEDTHELNKNRHVPQPIIISNGRSFGVPLEIDLETYDFKHIAQFNRKFIIFLWNKIAHKLEIYFETTSRLQKVLKEQTPLKKLSPSKNFVISVNEPKGLMAIYDNEKGKLDAYSFDEERTNLHLQFPNIKLEHWYHVIPEISHFIFIKNTEDICFVERNGRARIYNLTNNNFRPGIAQLPDNSNRVLSTPDGACIVAFVKEIIHSEDAHIAEILANVTDCPRKLQISSEISKDKNMQPDGAYKQENLINGVAATETSKEVVRAHIFFSENFTPNASMIIEVPLKNLSVELFQFSSIEMQQIHLITIDQHDGSFQSLVTNISRAKTKCGFEKSFWEKTVGRVKIESHDPFTVHGQNTNFTNDINVRDSLVIGNEKCQVIKVISSNELRISNKLFESLEYGKWIKFAIEPRTITNRLLDVYFMVYTKYAIASPIDRKDSPLKLTVVMMDLNSNELDIDEYEKKFQKYIKKSFEKFKEDTKKPIDHLKEFKSTCTTMKDLDLEGKYTEYKFGDWVIELFCLIPIQIAVARDNEFIPYRDGVSTREAEQPTLDDDFGLIGSVTKSISFGWCESILDYYADLKVKVISSMGEQSCGKSYLLNHFIGSTFDGSAMRCTEGVWMSLVRTDDTLYVALDFEGLSSIERSAQEETFLQLLNTALSNLVIFKSQFAVNRDISSMFQRFQDGSNYFGDDSDIFQARFCIVIKDVAKCDREGIVDEFHSKFARIVDREEDNFITKLYRDKVCIYPWPIFTDKAFYTKIKIIKSQLDKQESQYENVRMFVEKIKVLMAKLKVCDWGSIRETQIALRTLELKKFLKDAISYGYENQSSKFESNPTIKCLMGRDDGIPIPDYDILLSDTFENVDDSLKLMPDTGLVLLNDGENFVQVSSDLREYFEKHIFVRGSISDSEWMVNLDKFFKLIINRRIRRVREWLTKNTSKFPKERNEIYMINYTLDQEISRLNLFWNVCHVKIVD